MASVFRYLSRSVHLANRDTSACGSRLLSAVSFSSTTKPKLSDSIKDRLPSTTLSSERIESIRHLSSDKSPKLAVNECCQQDRRLPQIELPDYEKQIISDVNFQPTVLFKGLDSNFPCVARNDTQGPEPDYDKITTGYKTFNSKEPFYVKHNKGVLPELQVAYETWGELNVDKSNAVMIHAGLSASSHAKSHVDNPRPGWWEKFVGPGCAVDTSKFFVICCNNLGGCYGTSGPSSINPLTGQKYATTFPVISVEDMVRSQLKVMDSLGIDKLHASVGSSLGGMLSLTFAALSPQRVGRIVSISACGQSHPSSIAVRYLQRKCIMCDPNWNKGHYYEGPYPKTGMKLAREIATMTYRSGPEWDERFGRKRISDDPPSLCPTFVIENYLEHQGETFSTKFDPNSLLYISKAMDMFDIAEGYPTLEEGLQRITCPVMVIGVQTDILFPIWQQRELSEKLQKSGNTAVTYYELNSIYGHDTFLLDLNGVGAGVKGFLETRQTESGWLNKQNKKREKAREDS